MAPSFAPVPVLRRELLQEFELGGLRFTESWHTASSTIERHAHRRATLTLLVDGSFEEVYRFSRDVECTAPALHVRPPGEPHLDRLGKIGAHNLVIEVDDGRLESIRTHSTIFEEIRHLRSPRVISLVRTMHNELSIRDAASPLTLEGLALELLGTVSRDTRTVNAAAPGWLRRVHECLHDRFREQDLRLGELAVEAGVHPVHLTRTFRAHYGASPGEYVRQLRVEWAAREIRGSDRPLGEISADAGFSDQSHLSRLFKARIGWTPAAWRRLHRNG